MITEHDLQAAIAECNGKRNPDASTCIKLAAFYTIRDHLFPQKEGGYSYAPPPTEEAIYDTGSEFSDAIQGLSTADILSVMDEAMEALKVLNPAFYASIIRKIKNLK